MRINNNLMAMNTHRQLGLANAGGAKSMEKLSSGFRINRAGDDAAGLAISEKMRGQIRGLTQASRNAQDGISLIQTAEGALNETHAILQRMRELAVQSSTDTNTDDDRAEIQKEVDQLSQEITRIAETTQFNTQSLLKGDYKDKKFHIGANSEQNVTIDINNMTSKALGLETANKQTATVGDLNFDTQNADVKSIEVVITQAGSGGNGSASATLGDDGKLALAIVIKEGSGTEVTLADINAALEEHGVKADGTIPSATGTPAAVDFKAKVATLGGITEAYANIADDSIKSLTFAANGSATAGSVSVTKDTAGAVVVTAAGDVTLENLNKELKAYGIVIDSNTETVDKDTVLGTLSTSVVLDVDAGNVAIKVNTQGAADKAITTINDSLQTVSAERSKLGAMQNRLEHTIKNLDTSAENLQASEARIRDVDMAKEMMEQTKQNILAQASTAMLAQANAAPQAVLELLR